MSLLLVVLLAAVGVQTCHRAQPVKGIDSVQFMPTSAPLTKAAKPDFYKEIRPILQSRCMPCHFQGGKVYDKLPFDKPETITKLGTKLFTRIKDQKERRLISDFLN
jgi:hypothetical protein